MDYQNTSILIEDARRRGDWAQAARLCEAVGDDDSARAFAHIAIACEKGDKFRAIIADRLAAGDTFDAAGRAANQQVYGNPY